MKQTTLHTPALLRSAGVVARSSPHHAGTRRGGAMPHHHGRRNRRAGKGARVEFFYRGCSHTHNKSDKGRKVKNGERGRGRGIEENPASEKTAQEGAGRGAGTRAGAAPGQNAGARDRQRERLLGGKHEGPISRATDRVLSSSFWRGTKKGKRLGCRGNSSKKTRCQSAAGAKGGWRRADSCSLGRGGRGSIKRRRTTSPTTTTNCCCCCRCCCHRHRSTPAACPESYSPPP